MRLVCPNCDAKYEVPDDAIPDGGRDVQCSACGHAWFQLPFDPDAFAAELAAQAELPEEPSPADEVMVSTLSDDQEDSLSAALAEALADAPTATAEESGKTAAPRREMDGDVLAILRDEADREAEARRSDARREGVRKADAEGQMQVQAELGVDEQQPALTPTQRRLAMLQGKDPDISPEELAEPARPAARRDLLPDVEEINSTLQPEADYDPDREVDALPDLMRKHSSFRTGFFLVLIILGISALVYAMSSQLGERFPALKESLDAYREFVNSMRIWLNDRMNSATAVLTGKSSQ